MSFRYRLNLLQRASKPLGEAEKTYVRINDRGFLSFQHLIRQTDAQSTFVEFFIMADFEEEAEDDL